MTVTYKKNRDRSQYSFANINLLGKCNVDCYFCLGKDIEDVLKEQDQTAIRFEQWRNFYKFIERCETERIRNIYITGQNTDALIYQYLDELVDFLHDTGFAVGLRTNGYLAVEKMDTIKKCDRSVGYSIHSLLPQVNQRILGRKDVPDWKRIIPATPFPRIQVVVNRYNYREVFDIIEFASQFDNLTYVQLRRVSTDTRFEQLYRDMEVFEELAHYIELRSLEKRGVVRLEDYENAPQYLFLFNPRGEDVRVTLWRTVETTVNSINYFTDGTLSDKYFIIEGYLDSKKASEKQS